MQSVRGHQESIVDRNQFDNLARAMAKPASRRGAIAFAGRTIAAAFGLGAAMSPWTGPESGDAAGCRAQGVTCTSNAHCCSGSCGPKDGRGRRTCQCGGNETFCGGACLDPDVLLADPENCGECGQVCPSSPAGGAVCREGVCGIDCEADLQTDPDNCGACGTVCTAGDELGTPICAAGKCDVTCPAGYLPFEKRCYPELPNRAPCDASSQCQGGICACRSATCAEAICAMPSTDPSCNYFATAPVIDGPTAFVCTTLDFTEFDCTAVACPSAADICIGGTMCVPAAL
jgi:hypothetical protein